MRPFTAAWFRQERAATAKRWYLWPYYLTLGVFMAGGIAWCVYKAYWSGVAFTSAVLTLHVLLFLMPTRAGWKAHQVAKHADR
jgi:hypothetical protein